MLERLADWAIEIVETLGYTGVALLVLIENVFPPIPSEIVLTLAGFVASRGDATLPGMIVAATAGSLGGALLLYGIAAWFGSARVHAIAARYERWLRITQRDIDRAEAMFDRWSVWAVLFCRCIPLVRSLISVPAGLRRMPLVLFVVLTTVGSLVWNTIFIMAGFLLGERWEVFVEYADYLKYPVYAAIVIVALLALWQWRVRGRKGDGPGTQSAEMVSSASGEDSRRPSR